MAWGESCRGAFQKWADDVDDQSFTYANIAQYYKKPVRFVPPRVDTRFANATPSYDPAQVRSNGTVGVTYAAYAYSWTTWLATMLDAAGLKATNSFMDGALNGSAWHMSAVDQNTGTRSAADVAYLRPILEKSTLTIFDKTLSERIIFNDNKVATGVKVSSKNGTYTITAKKEVIVAGGVFMSPQLLQVSGVGPKELLKKHNISVVADLPGVGQNMHDQVFADIVYRVDLPTGSTLGTTEADVEAYQKNGTGPLSNPGGEFGGFEKIPVDLRTGFSNATSQGEFPSPFAA
jgi:choline dehydrogenase